MLLVFDVQVFQGRDERLSLEASGCPGHHWGVADSTVCSDGDNVASQGGPHVAHLVHSLGHTTDMEPPAEVNAVQDLPGSIKYLRRLLTRCLLMVMCGTLGRPLSADKTAQPKS